MVLNALIASTVSAALVALERASSISAVRYVRGDRESLFTASKSVRTFDSNNFAATLNDTEIVWLVDFYSPWCPHCQQFAPQWEQLANVYVNVDNIQFGAVDCTKQNDICEQEGVYSYPGVKMYHVPPEAKEAVMMPHEEYMYAKDVAKWIEEMLKENKMKPGINIDTVYPNNTFHSNVKKKMLKFGDPVEPLFDDQSVEIHLRRLKDAGSTVLLTFENGFFMGTTVLEGDRYEAALTWVRALAVGFPLKENRDALAMLVNELKQQKQWKQADWKAAMSRWKATANAMTYPANLFADKDDLVLCKTFTCGLWTVFHMLTVSDINSQSRLEQWKPSEIMSAIRLVVMYFFGCEECKRHFLKINTDSLIKKLARRDDGGTHALTMWVWTIHNMVNKLLSKPMWPTKRSCPHCYATSDQLPSLDPMVLNEQDIAAYIRSVYRFENELKMKQDGNVVKPSFSKESMATVALLVAILALLFQQFKHRLNMVTASKTRASSHKSM